MGASSEKSLSPRPDVAGFDEGPGDSSSLALPTWDPAVERALVRKLDLRIFPSMILLFILNFIDRNNFANARLAGLQTDLGLSDTEYATCLSILLVGYVCLQIPSNMVLNSLTHPRLYLCSCVAVWGCISAATGAARDAGGAIACRFCLGCVEAAFFPGSLYFLSRWYTRKEMQLRVTILNGGNLAAQAFGGLIAAGVLGNMNGDRGIASWRWLFIIEGSLTVFFAIITYFVLPEYPGRTPWLSHEENGIAVQRLQLDAGLAGVETEEEEITSLQGLLLAVKDLKVWLLGLTYFVTIMGLSFSFYFPTLVGSLGYNSTETLLLTAPPWIWAIIVSLPIAWHADRTGERFFHFSLPVLVCIVGYILAMSTTTIAPRYIGMFLMTTGYAAGFVMLAWISNTITRPVAKKAAAIAMVNAMGNIGSIPGSYIWPSSYGPSYVRSFGAEIAILGFASLCGLALRFYLIAQNKKLDREEKSSVQAAESVFGGKTRSDYENGRKSRNFKYLY